MMMNSQYQRVIESTNSLSIIPKPLLIINGNISLLPIYRKRYNIPKKYGNFCIRASSGEVRAVSSRVTEKEEQIKITEKEIKDFSKKEIIVKALVTVQVTSGDLLDLFTLTFPLDVISDLFGRTLFLELVSTDLDSGTGREKETLKGYARKVWSKIDGEINYECDFTVPAGFGEVGAVLVENKLHTELYLKNIILDGFLNGPVNVSCDSFVHSKFDNPTKRIFFTNKSYLPSNTPSGLKRLRKEELVNLRGNGQGERKKFERIYDYDTYNDLGDPESSEDLRRPVLGGKEYPYPRRCRTGRPRYKNEKDKDSEQRSSDVYVPRDEEFADTKQTSFGLNLFRSALPSLIPQIENLIEDPRLGFPYFTAIDSLFNEEETVKLPKFRKAGILQSVLRWLLGIVKAVVNQADLFQFETPDLLDRDKFAWMRDEEFARQMLAGLNPYCIELVTDWPLKSKLDPEIYGSPESLITTDLVEKEIRGIMTVKEALDQKRLFLLDYHDLYLPYVHKVRSIEGTTLYGSRTLLFLNNDSTLRLIAIELTRPPIDDKPQWKQVFTPSYDATDCWLWRLAKAHVCAHDAGFHQLVTHWLRTHCCAETYIIAAHRQLSAVHPIYRLLHPHFRYTMEINAQARASLINAGGIIERTFSPGKYSVELSSVAYDKLWRFDMESLPADLIRRGMAVEDPTAKHGLKLTIEDYPFANDGLDLWDAIKQWVTEYVNHYYPNPALVESDTELQAWWEEVRTKAHEDKKDEPWWPVLKTPEDVIQVLTTIIWVSSAHHAAVNFGQYLFGGYFPNRPTITRINMPTEDPKEEDFNNFLKKPDLTMLQSFPSQIQATTVVTVLGVLSSHSEDEEYIGEQAEPSWKEDPFINAAYERFCGRLKVLEGTIDQRNINLKLKNRTGAGVVPYELLKPVSPPGVTGKGVPNSISI